MLTKVGAGGFGDDVGVSNLSWLKKFQCRIQYIYLINQARGPYWENVGPRADILPVQSRVSLVNKRFITRLKKAFKVFHKLWFPSLLLISLVLGVSTAGAGQHHSSCF